jgi:ATP-dependent helicase/nuclease subunit B
MIKILDRNAESRRDPPGGRGGMKLVFDQSFDGGAYPGPLADCTATMGELWLGPLGLLDILETRLGLGGPTFTSAERTVDRLPVLASQEGFWSRSSARDPMATASVLLQWRDYLAMCGWTGIGASPRLEALASVTADVLPGLPDRLRRVSDALQSRNPGIESIKRLLPVNDLPCLWQRVFAQMEQRDVIITDEPLPDAIATGNLGVASQPDFQPAPGDDSLLLLSPMGAMEAAECVAAHLAGLPDPGSVVLVSPDAVLDRALARYGLPVSGASGDSGGRNLLQVLPLVLACGWNPTDPQAVLELLMLEPGPVPRGIARGLAQAMHDWPSRSSAIWRKELGAGLETIDDLEYRSRVEQRLSVIFDVSATVGSTFPAAAALDRTDCVREWMESRQRVHPDGSGGATPAAWSAAVTQCHQFKRLVELSDQPEFSAYELSQLLAGANDSLPLPESRPAEAGFSRVGDPGGVAGPVDRIIWWSFTRDSVPSIPRVPLSTNERAALGAAGVELPDPGDLAIAAAERWRRPLLQARKSLVLVCPQGGGDEHATGYHPLWDEIIGNLAGPAEQISVAIRQDLDSLTGAARTARTPQALPAPKRAWQATVDIPPREKESPTGAGALVGCSLKWVLQYACGLYAGATAELPGDSTLWGSIVHDIVARVLKEGTASPDAARLRSEQLFEELIPGMAAALCLPGGEAERARVKRAVSLTAQALRQVMLDSGAALVSAEKEYIEPGLGTLLRGTPDLVIDTPNRVIDIKWGGHGYRRDSLQHGTAYQLAVYSQLAREDGEDPLPNAYFVCGNQRLLTTNQNAFPKANPLQGLGPADTWTAFEAAYAARMQELSQGQVVAAAVEDSEGNGPPKKDGVFEGLTVLKPPCTFCDYQSLCGKGES